jgi:hypothetical protein
MYCPDTATTGSSTAMTDEMKPGSGFSKKDTRSTSDRVR